MTTIRRTKIPWVNLKFLEFYRIKKFPEFSRFSRVVRTLENIAVARHGLIYDLGPGKSPSPSQFPRQHCGRVAFIPRHRYKSSPILRNIQHCLYGSATRTKRLILNKLSDTQIHRLSILHHGVQWYNKCKYVAIYTVKCHAARGMTMQSLLTLQYSSDVVYKKLSGSPFGWKSLRIKRSDLRNS